MEVHYSESRDVTSLQGWGFFTFSQWFSTKHRGSLSRYIILPFAYLLKVVIFPHLQISVSLTVNYIVKQTSDILGDNDHCPGAGAFKRVLIFGHQSIV